VRREQAARVTMAAARASTLLAHSAVTVNPATNHSATPSQHASVCIGVGITKSEVGVRVATTYD